VCTRTISGEHTQSSQDTLKVLSPPSFPRVPQHSHINEASPIPVAKETALSPSAQCHPWPILLVHNSVYHWKDDNPVPPGAVWPACAWGAIPKPHEGLAEVCVLARLQPVNASADALIWAQLPHFCKSSCRVGGPVPKGTCTQMLTAVVYGGKPLATLQMPTGEHWGHILQLRDDFISVYGPRGGHQSVCVVSLWGRWQAVRNGTGSLSHSCKKKQTGTCLHILSTENDIKDSPQPGAGGSCL
jgi:hypothetical protein